jgi:hypothetical protein
LSKEAFEELEEDGENVHKSSGKWVVERILTADL